MKLYALMLLCVCTVIYSLAWPDPIAHRGAIAFSISVYTTSDNTPMRTRVWPCKSTVACLCPLHYHMGTSILSLLYCYQNFQYLCSIIHLMSTNSASADNAPVSTKFKSLDKFLTLNCDNAHY